MSFHQQMNFCYDNTFVSSSQSTTYIPTFNQYSSIQIPNPYQYHSTNSLICSNHSNLLSPNYSEYNSHSIDMTNNQSTFRYRQPIMNPHQRFLSRHKSNCPSHLSTRKQNKWWKAGQKAQNNQRLLAQLEPFHWPALNYDPPLYIHRQTSELHLQGIIYKLSNVHLYTIDTESDKPTRQNPHSVPALIQVQAIHEENYSTIIIIEVQHLPHSSTSLFHLIQQLCHLIFSSNHKLMAWGDVKNELCSFEQFNLFDLSQLTDVLNLQEYFTREWNRTHPHTIDCLTHHQPIVDEPTSEDFLVCLVNSNDLDDEFDSNNPTEDFNTCSCPTEHRPYKAKNSIWALQKAIELVFHQALDKSMTLNYWSSGIDPILHTWRTNYDKNVRYSLTTYAMNDLFAPTNLYFHIQKSSISSQHINSSTQLNSIYNPLSFIIISDSHGKYFPPIIHTSNSKQITKSISGLQWINHYNKELCTRTLILSSSISSIISSCHGIFFLVGTNSTRTTMAPQIIQQIDEIIDLIRSQHAHLRRKHTITIALTFPCVKVSSLFPTHDLLLSNITQYNNLLKELSFQKHFNVLDIPLTPNQLHYDGMHIHVHSLPYIHNYIQQYLNTVIQHQIKSNQKHNRSRAAISRPNKRRHEKLRQRQLVQTITRPIARIWKLNDLKSYLKYKNIKYNRLPEIRNHQLSLQFNHIIHQQQAEQTLMFNDFDEDSYHRWIAMKH